ncbi:hypothetical protein C8J57DRAFT_1229120 [Mycena rebaudengoi]|nr:hypothetical protein C8J57DRAFT_1229120 [Mycena rebaudengoi]
MSWNLFDSLHISDTPLSPFANSPIRSYHSSDESEHGSHGGGGFYGHGHGMSGGGSEFMPGAGRPHSPPFTADVGSFDDRPYLPPRDNQPPQQCVAPASLTLPLNPYTGAPDRSYYRNDPRDVPSWPGQQGPDLSSPPPYYAQFDYPTVAVPIFHCDVTEYVPVEWLNLAPGQPVNLWSLPDPPNGEKPSVPLPMLIKLAIYGSHKQKLTLQEIYAELTNRFVWFREHQGELAWKNSIRHNLSLNKVFRNIPRPVTEPGKGSYWGLDVSGGEGYKRPRKRLSTRKNAGGEDIEEEVSDDGSYSETDHSVQQRGTRRRPYIQGGLRVSTDNRAARDSSSPPTTGGSSRSGSVPTTIDPPASQRRAPASTAYPRPSGSGHSNYDHFPGQASSRAGPSAYASSSHYAPPHPDHHRLAHSRSATPLVDSSAYQLRPRESRSSSSGNMEGSSSSGSSRGSDETPGRSHRRSGRT